MLGGLTTCELSVDDGEPQNEQDEVYRNRCDDWNDRAEAWVQNEMTDGHTIENWVQNEMTNGHKLENWAQNEVTDGHKSRMAQKLDPEQDDGLSWNVGQKME